MTNQNCKWFIVIKYTQDNWLGTMVAEIRSDEMEAAGNGDMEWRINVTLGAK